jgi:hypothetical protein
MLGAVSNALYHCHALKQPAASALSLICHVGAFGNRREWILAAIERANAKYNAWPIDVKMVNYAP